MKDDRPTKSTTADDVGVSRRDVLRSLPLGLTLTPELKQSSAEVVFAKQHAARRLSEPRADHGTISDIARSVRTAAEDCLMLDSKIRVREDLFRRFGSASGELSLRDQLTEIPDEHCDLYTRVTLQNQRTKRCLAIDRERDDSDSVPATVDSCAETPAQEWKLIGLPGGTVTLQNHGTGRCLAIDRERHDYEGAPVTAESCADTVEQEWKVTLRSNGTVKLQNRGTGRCLNVHGGRHDYDGAPVTSYTCAETPDQEWNLLYKATGHEGRIYGSGRSEEFFIRPVTDAEYAVNDVVRAFEAIEFGRSSGENFYSREVGFAATGHMQGVARLPGGGLIQTYSKSFFLSYFPEKSEYGHEPWRTRSDRVETMPPARRPGWDGTHIGGGHVGGVHAYDDIVVVPWGRDGTKAVTIYRHGGWGKTESGERYWNGHELTTQDITEYQGGAHYASILPLADGTWLLAVGKDPRRGWKVSRVHFYAIKEFPEYSRRYPGRESEEADFQYLGYWHRGETWDDFQSLSLVAGSSGRVFLIGTGVQVVPSNSHAKLYEVLSFSRSDSNRPEPRVRKITQRSPDSQRNDCNLNAGATFFPTASGRLAMYCTEKSVKDGSVTTREYRDEDGSR